MKIVTSDQPIVAGANLLRAVSYRTNATCCQSSLTFNEVSTIYAEQWDKEVVQVLPDPIRSRGWY